MKKLFAVILSLTLIIAPIPVVSTAHASNAQMVQQLVGLANGIIGGSIIKKCQMASMQPSLMAYMAGSLAYIAGEIITAKNKSSDISKQADALQNLKDNMTEGGDYQKKALEAQLDNEKSNLRFIQKRKTFVTATTAVYAVATVLAIIEYWRSLPTPAGANVPDSGACSANEAANELHMIAIAGAYTALASSGGNLSFGGIALGTATAVAIQKITMMLKSASSTAEKSTVPLLDGALSRAVTFGVMTGVVGYIVSELSKEESDAKERIAQLEKVMGILPGGDDNQLALDDPNKDGKDDEANDPNNPLNKNYALKALPTGKTSKQCIGSDLSISETACSKSYKFTKTKLNSAIKIPALQTALNTTNDYAQAVADGDMDRAEVLAGDLANSASRIGKIRDELLKNLNENLPKVGKNKIDFQKEMHNRAAAMNAAFSKALGSDFSSPQLADVGSAAVGEEIGKGGNTVAPPITNGNVAEAVDLGAGDISLSDNSVNEDTKISGETVASLERSLQDYETNEGEISKNPDVSIFKQLSNRYFLNYTKIFSRKKAPAPEPNQ